jgi:hypothetical protein
MARAYSVAAAAFALEVAPRWLDNFLSQHTVPGVVAAERGVARRIPLSALVLVAIARDLQRELGVGLGRGLDAARRLVEPDGDSGLLPIGDAGVLRVDVAALRRAIEDRLVIAMEILVAPRRGRPPAR